MKITEAHLNIKPLIRGHVHQAAFFFALIGSGLLIYKSHESTALFANIVYSISLCGMYGISALYHCPLWSRKSYLFMRRIDYAAIFALIAGTATPICLVGIKGELGLQLITVLWVIAMVGMVITVFWAHGSKWMRSLLYIAMGWLAIPYISDIQAALGMKNVELLIAGGVIYTLGAMIYSFKYPNPYPRVFGYHEIFHVMIVVASIFHFRVIYGLIY